MWSTILSVACGGSVVGSSSRVEGGGARRVETSVVYEIKSAWRSSVSDVERSRGQHTSDWRFIEDHNSIVSNDTRVLAAGID
jgi:hypothetical protein